MEISVEVCVQDCWHNFGENGTAENNTAESNTAENNTVESNPAESNTANLEPSSWKISSEDWLDWFQRWLEALQIELSPIAAYELSVRLTGDREMQTLNAQYRQQDNPTDVLAFAALETDSPEVDESKDLPLYLGDIVISMETAQRQAQAQGHPLEIEMAWLASHGLLHLLGWDHPDDKSLLRMLSEQKTLLHTVGLLVRDS
jgi:probable rRNA maturation factor